MDNGESVYDRLRETCALSTVNVRYMYKFYFIIQLISFAVQDKFMRFTTSLV